MQQLIVAAFLACFALEFITEFILNELNLRYVRARWTEKGFRIFFTARLVRKNMTSRWSTLLRRAVRALG